MARNRAVHVRAFAALIVVVAACLAALIAHIGIDLAGDVVLTRDTYDALDHRSRGEMVFIALGCVSAGLLRLVKLAFDEARGGRSAARPTLDDLFGRERGRFIVAVIALTVPALMTMELFDLIADGRALDDVTDLLGGSVWLASCITVPTAALVAIMVRSIAAFVMRSRGALVTVIGHLLLPRTIRQSLVGGTVDARVPSFSIRRCSILSRRAGKRGPPVLIS